MGASLRTAPYLSGKPYDLPQRSVQPPRVSHRHSLTVTTLLSGEGLDASPLLY